MQTAFVHRTASAKVISRPGACALLGDELAQIEVRRPVVVTGRRTARSPAYERSVASLCGSAICEYKEIPQHSSVDTVAAVVRLARAHRADGFVAIGGGSASDTAKAAALWLAEGGELASHASRFTPPADLVVPELDRPEAADRRRAVHRFGGGSHVERRHTHKRRAQAPVFGHEARRSDHPARCRRQCRGARADHAGDRHERPCALHRRTLREAAHAADRRVREARDRPVSRSIAGRPPRAGFG